MPAADQLDIPLTELQRRVLSHGINEWGGPGRCTEEFARAMGFHSVTDLFDERPRLHKAIRCKTPLSQTDWVRVLLMAEVVFASDVVGSGMDWETTTRLTDTQTIAALREIQPKIPRAGVIGTTIGTLPSRPIG